METSPEAKVSVLNKVRNNLGENLPYLVALGLVLLFLLVYLWPRIFITVHSGEAGVLFKRFGAGTVTDYVYPEGFYIVNPFNKMYIYDVRNQTKYHILEALTKKGLPVTVDLAIRFHPQLDLVGMLHKRVGPDYVNVVVIPEVEATIRAIAGQYDPDEIYTTQRDLLEQIVNKALAQVGERHVHIDDVMIRKITLPEKIRQEIDLKMAERERFEAYQFILKREEQEAERKRIESKGIRDYQKTVAETLTPDILKFKGILATQELAKSDNSKIVVIGSGEKGLPIILGGNN